MPGPEQERKDSIVGRKRICKRKGETREGRLKTPTSSTACRAKKKGGRKGDNRTTGHQDSIRRGLDIQRNKLGTNGGKKG